MPKPIPAILALLLGLALLGTASLAAAQYSRTVVC
jgi:hypothetical protein